MQISYKVVEIQEREIIISSKASRINVSTDMNAEKLAFKMPRYYNDLDLTSLDLVLYIKGVDVSDILAIRGYEVIDGYIVWEFVPQGAMLLKSGYIDVQVTGVQIVNNTLEVKWQTKIKENAFYINNTLIDIVETVVKPLPTELEQYRAEIVRLIESVNLDDVVMDITADTENVLVLHRGNGTHSNVALNVRGGITLEEVNQVVNTHNASADTHQDIRGKIAENTASINANTTKITENTNKIGDLPTLTTTQKGNLVGAINEIDGDINVLSQTIDDRAYKFKGRFTGDLLRISSKTPSSYTIGELNTISNAPIGAIKWSHITFMPLSQDGTAGILRYQNNISYGNDNCFEVYINGTGGGVWKQFATTDKTEILSSNATITDATTQIKMVNGWVRSSESYRHLITRAGDIVTINAFISNPSQQTSSKVFLQLPTNLRPKAQILTTGYTSSSQILTLHIYQNGDIEFLNSVPTHTWINLCISYTIG